MSSKKCGLTGKANLLSFLIFLLFSWKSIQLTSLYTWYNLPVFIGFDFVRENCWLSFPFLDYYLKITDSLRLKFMLLFHWKKSRNLNHPFICENSRLSGIYVFPYPGYDFFFSINGTVNEVLTINDRLSDRRWVSGRKFGTSRMRPLTLVVRRIHQGSFTSSQAPKLPSWWCQKKNFFLMLNFSPSPLLAIYNNSFAVIIHFYLIIILVFSSFYIILSANLFW